MTDHEFKAPEPTNTELDETTARLAEIRERVQAATDGPWLAVAGEGPSDWPIVIPDGSDLGTYLCASPDDGVRGGHSEADAKFIAAARADVPWLLSEVERLTAECDRARGLAARLEAQLAQVAEVVHGMETLRYVGMTTSADVSDVEAAARTQRAVRAHAADLWAALEGAPKDGDVEYQVDPVLEYQVDPVLEYQVDPVLEYLDRLKGMDPSPTLAGQIAELEAAHHAKNGGE